MVLHLLGNLTLFAGPAAADGYAAALRRTGPLIWLVRAGVLAAAVAHIWATVALARRAPAGSRLIHLRRSRAATFASRSMRVGGLLLLLFVVFHILHLTTGTVHPDFLPGRVHHNVTRGLGGPIVAAVYLLASGLLGLHLSHGLWAAAGSLGLQPERDPRRGRRRAAVLAAALALGFASIPLAIIAGVLS